MTSPSQSECSRNTRSASCGFSAAGLALVAIVVLLGLAACSTPAELREDPRLGRLTIDISGLPAGSAAAVSIDGPNAYQKTVLQSATLTGLEPGEYFVSVSPAEAPNATFTATPSTDAVQVEANDTANVRVAYACHSVQPSDPGLAQAMLDTITSKHGPQPQGRINCNLLSQLIELYAVNMGVSDPTLAGLQYATSLDSIDLSGNRLTSLADDAFVGLPDLRHLNLKENAFTDYPLAAIANLESLQSLDLSHNKLATLPDGAFVGLEGVRVLLLNGNEITNLAAGTFSDSPVLEYLDLSGNRLTSLEPAVFAGLTSLTYLHLGENLLTELQSGAFESLGLIDQLYLADNQLTEIPGGAFAGMTSLKVLALDNNDIELLTADSFTGLDSLDVLNLGRNKLASLALEWFSPLASLDELRLNSNCLEVDNEPTATVLADLAQLVGTLDYQKNPALGCTA